MPPLDVRQRAIILLDQLPQNKLAAVVQLLKVLAEPTSQPSANPEEAQLLEVIQRHLPASEQTRLDDLRDAQRAARANAANGANSLMPNTRNLSATKTC